MCDTLTNLKDTLSALLPLRMQRRPLFCLDLGQSLLESQQATEGGGLALVLRVLDRHLGVKAGIGRGVGSRGPRVPALCTPVTSTSSCRLPQLQLIRLLSACCFKKRGIGVVRDRQTKQPIPSKYFGLVRFKAVSQQLT